MSQAINAYYRITASSEFRERERLYEKARHDEAQALHHAELRGRERGLTEGMNKGQAEIVKRMYARGRSLEEISGMTDLPLEKVKQLVEQE